MHFLLVHAWLLLLAASFDAKESSFCSIITLTTDNIINKSGITTKAVMTSITIMNGIIANKKNNAVNASKCTS